MRWSPYLLPEDTASVVEPEEIENFALKFSKYPVFYEKKFIFYKRDRKKELYNITKKLNIKPDFVKSILTRHKNSIISLLGNEKITSFISSTLTRIIIGLGHESVYEVGLTLHYIYGIPYIPGQALKGVTRSYIINEFFNQDEKLALRDTIFRIIFGSPKESLLEEQQGAIIFFDAFPTEVKLEVDVMNPHYGKYYSEKGKVEAPPADYLNPVPIYFLTLSKQTKFEFIVGAKKIIKVGEIDKKLESPLRADLESHTPVHILVSKFLKKAISEQGIGAKTAVGYGYFSAT